MCLWGLIPYLYGLSAHSGRFYRSPWMLAVGAAVRGEIHFGGSSSYSPYLVEDEPRNN